MIEIEKKFLLSPLQQSALLDHAHKLEEKTIEDSYYDTDDHRLTLRNLWLRKRNGDYELKVPLHPTGSTSSTASRFHELTTTEEISQELDMNKNADFESALLRAAIKNFMTCYTSRESYTKQGFRIDIDSATYLGTDFTHAVAEIELLIDSAAKADEAELRIDEFAKGFGLSTDEFIPGKVAAYIKAERPEHYNALVAAGVFE